MAGDFTMLSDDGEHLTCPMPADDSVVEVLLDDGSTVRAWYGANLSEPGDWDFVPVEAGDDEPDDADSIADRVRGWRPALESSDAR